MIPNDTLFSSEWWAYNTGQMSGNYNFDLKITRAWDYVPSVWNSVRVGVIDTGVDFDHPDLMPVEKGPDFVFGGDPVDNCFHGSAVAGIIAGRGNNGIGVAGINWYGAVPVAIKVYDRCDPDGSTIDRIISAIDWSRANQIPIVNLSLGGPGATDLEKAVLKNAHASGMLVVAAMGNDDANIANYPAADKNHVEAVGAMGGTGYRWSYSATPRQWLCDAYGYEGVWGSSYGNWIDLIAPGGRAITTTSKNHGYLEGVACTAGFGGTSAAAPMVSGVASLISSHVSGLSGEDLSEIMHRTARDLTQYGLGKDDQSGWGCVDAFAALQWVTRLPTGPTRLIVHGVATSATEEPGTELQTTMAFYNVPGLAPGLYNVKRHEMRAWVLFGYNYDAPPDVWGKGYGSVGWTVTSPHYDLDEASAWCEVVPGSVQRDRCQLRTYIYEVSDLALTPIGWFPANRSGVRMTWTSIGNWNTTTGVEEEGAVLKLGASFHPNPVSGRGQISYVLPRESSVTISIFDVNGRLVRRWTTRDLAGAHSQTWDMLDRREDKVASGVYMYEVRTNVGRRSGRLVVLR